MSREREHLIKRLNDMLVRRQSGAAPLLFGENPYKAPELSTPQKSAQFRDVFELAWRVLVVFLITVLLGVVVMILAIEARREIEQSRRWREYNARERTRMQGRLPITRIGQHASGSDK